MKEIIVNKLEEGMTLEKFVKKHFENAPLSFIYKAFRKKDIKVNSKRTGDLKMRLNENDIVCVYFSDKQLEDFALRREVNVCKSISSMIVYEDDNIIIIDKPGGLLVQRNEKNGEALDQYVRGYFLSKNECLNTCAFLPSPAHRIDRNTTGLVIFGKNVSSMKVLFEAFKTRSGIKKNYLALVNGNPPNSGKIDIPLIKDSLTGKVKKGTIESGAKTAITEFNTIKRFKNDFALLDIRLLTGRTHQIRAHMALLGFPLVGDSKYGDFGKNRMIEDKYHFSNQFLHAYRIEFNNLCYPLDYLNGKVFETKLHDFQIDLLNQLEKDD